MNFFKCFLMSILVAACIALPACMTTETSTPEKIKTIITQYQTSSNSIRMASSLAGLNISKDQVKNILDQLVKSEWTTQKMEDEILSLYDKYMATQAKKGVSHP